MRDFYHLNNVSIVIDTNVLVDLYELDCLDIIFKLFNEVIIPAVIFDFELTSEVKSILNNHSFTRGKIMTNIGLETYNRLVNETQFNKLSSADRFAIAIAKENTYFCNSNDKPVRNACELLNVR